MYLRASCIFTHPMISTTMDLRTIMATNMRWKIIMYYLWKIRSPLVWITGWRFISGMCPGLQNKCGHPMPPTGKGPTTCFSRPGTRRAFSALEWLRQSHRPARFKLKKAISKGASASIPPFSWTRMIEPICISAAYGADS
ncbi:hypothetical protein D3C81_1499950 [compost metagenome]